MSGKYPISAPNDDPQSREFRSWAYQRWCYEHPVEWTRQVLGVELYYEQRQIFHAVRNHTYVSVASSNAVGKSFLSAVIAIWYLNCHRPSYVITTSSSWTGLKKILWPRIRTLRRQAKIPAVSEAGTALDIEWKLDDEWGAFGVSPKDPENFAGFRTSNGVMVIVDEASALEEEIMQAIMGLCAGDLCKVLMIGNPLRPQGPFFDSFRSPLWNTRHLSAFDSPNVKTGRNIIPGLATRRWVEEREVEWGKDSAPYLARVLGQFPREGDDIVISLFDAEQAVERYKQWLDEPIQDPHAEMRLGVDVARFGHDQTVLQPVYGMTAFEPIKRGKTSVTETVGMVVEEIRKYEALGTPIQIVNIDEIGVGGGVVDLLRDLGYHQCIGINVSETAQDPEHYFNQRAEGWFGLRDWLRQGGRIPDDRSIIGSITAPKYKYGTKGQLKIEPKKDIKKRLGRSPDEAEALMLALMTGEAPVESW